MHTYAYIHMYVYVIMMMIAFITIKFGLVPLSEGLCTHWQICYFVFEIICGLRSHLLLFLSDRKSMLKEKAVSPRSNPPLTYN